MTSSSDVHAAVEWHPGIIRDGWAIPVAVHFTAGGWQPYVPATWEQPAEGGLFEDTEFVRAELLDEGEPPLTEAETALARVWFESADWRASDMIQSAALNAQGRRTRGWLSGVYSKLSDGPDPDHARDAAWDRAQMERERAFDDEVEF